MAVTESAAYSLRSVGAPALTNPGVVGITNTGGEIYVTTTQTGGTAYYIADLLQGATPTGEQVKNGLRSDGQIAAVSNAVSVTSAGGIGPYRVEVFPQGEVVSYYWYHEIADLGSNVAGGSFRVLVDDDGGTDPGEPGTPPATGSPDTLTSFYNTADTADPLLTTDEEEEAQQILDRQALGGLTSGIKARTKK